jgi:hypothetical protein
MRQFMNRRLQRWSIGDVLIGLLPMGLWSCAVSNPPPSPPTSFTGVETQDWLTEESAPVNRSDVLPAFQAAARNHGCRTEELGARSGEDIGGGYRSYYGISASCEEGTIALITLEGGGVRIGCAKPTTRQACDSLLREIAGR